MMSNPFTFIDSQTAYYNQQTKKLNAYRVMFLMEKFSNHITECTKSFSKAKSDEDFMSATGRILAAAFAFRECAFEIVGKKKKPHFKEGGFTGHGTDEVSLSPKIKNHCNEFSFRPKA